MTTTLNLSNKKKPVSAKASALNGAVVQVGNNSEHPIKIAMGLLYPGVAIKATLKNGTVIMGDVTQIARQKGMTGSTTAFVQTESGETHAVNWRFGACKVKSMGTKETPGAIKASSDITYNPDGTLIALTDVRPLSIKELREALTQK